MTKPVDFPSPDETTTLVRGSTVMLADGFGEAQPTALLGLFCRDERVLSKLSVLVDGSRPPLLSHARNGASSVRIASLASLDEYRNGQALLVRRGTVTEGGFGETLELRSFSQHRTVALEIVLESDGSSVLDLRTGKPRLNALIWKQNTDGSATAARLGVPLARVTLAPCASASLAIQADGTQVVLRWGVELGNDAPWTTGWSVESIGLARVASDRAGALSFVSGAPGPARRSVKSTVRSGDEVGPAAFDTGADVDLGADTDLADADIDLADADTDLGADADPRAKTYPPLGRLTVTGDDFRWSKAIASAIDDLDALTIELPEEGHRFIAAGAPWFLALFGRDSLIAAWQALPLGTELPLNVLETLAAYQGESSNERTQEAPGKILHERRIGRPQVFGMAEGATYYGSVDSSALFVMLLAEIYRWGGSVSRVRALLPAARAALGWCLGAGRDAGPVAGSPFLWYQSDAKGLGNQGWKDSGDCMVHEDGTLAEGPFAVAEAQGYLHEALMGMARLERDLGDPVAGDTFAAQAQVLAAAFESEFVLEDGLLAMALVGDGVPLRVASSNMGQVLWSGILSAPVAAAAAERTMRADLRSEWGIRTLGSNTRAYNPMGYHLGTVWAHDSAIVAAGMARHGFGSLTRPLVDSLLAAAEAFHWRLPELFAGIDTPGDTQPLPYPAACSPQAWSAGAPLLLLRSILGFAPDVPAGFVALSPMLTEGSNLAVAGIQLGDRTIAISARGSTTISVSGCDDLAVQAEV